MTTWAPQIENRAGPLYRAICDALADDIASGKVGPGMRLPTHRDLAWKLGVTVGTVTRAYAEAERRGLISGEVGRGTYVKAPSPDYPQRRPDDFVERRAEGHPEAAFIDLAGNSPPPAPATAEVARAFLAMASDNDLQELLRYRPSQGLETHRAAGALWVADSGLKVDPSQVIPTHGAQQGLLLAVGAVLRAGDVLLCEDLTFFGIKSVARLLGLRLHGVSHDDEGVLPDALEQTIRQTGARAFYSIPTLQNPTNSILTEERRKAVAEICRRHGVTVIEDDIYRFLVPEAPPPLAHFLPEQTLYVTNLSKCVAPALRVGFVAGPAHLIKETFLAMRASSVMASPLLQEVAARLIRDGTARLSAEMTRRETMVRQKLGKTILGHLPQASHPAAFHVWLRLPDQWRPEAFAAAAQRRNVGVAAADVFAASRQPSERAVRVCLTAARTHEQLRAGLEIIADLIGSDRGRDMPLI